jgi:hypothetical protein
VEPGKLSHVFVPGKMVVFLSMHTAVLERTGEAGILKAPGASPACASGFTTGHGLFPAASSSAWRADHPHDHP